MDDTGSETSSETSSSAASPDTGAHGPGTGDLQYDAFYGGAIGGAAIALFFLAVDAVGGRPMFTPSLFGTVMFTDADPAAVSEVRLDMVAFFSAVHMIAFLALGGVIPYALKVLGLSRSNLPVVALVAFVVVTAAFFGGELLLMPGAASVIGIPVILAANAVTGLAIATFLKVAHAGD